MPAVQHSYMNPTASLRHELCSELGKTLCNRTFNNSLQSRVIICLWFYMIMVAIEVCCDAECGGRVVQNLIKFFIEFSNTRLMQFRWYNRLIWTADPLLPHHQIIKEVLHMFLHLINVLDDFMMIHYAYIYLESFEFLTWDDNAQYIWWAKAIRLRWTFSSCARDGISQKLSRHR